MKLRIHRGTREIGGTCVEVKSGSDRILLDLGLPLDADSLLSVQMPAAPGLLEPDAGLKAIILSHGHRDHWGLLPKARTDIPLVMGKATASIMRAAADFIPDGYSPTASQYLQNRKRLQIGAFAVTPFLVDHSGFDAYALEIEADGRRLFYSGDLRSHGRKGRLFDELIQNPPKGIDVMLMEGSSLGRLRDDEKFKSEYELEKLFIDRFKSSEGMVLVVCSAQNIDRVVTIYRAAKQTGRTLIFDAYAAEVLIATGHESIPKPVRGWTNLAVYIPQVQRIALKQKGIASKVDHYRSFRVWPEELAELAPKAVMLFRPGMFRDLDKAGALKKASLIWSQWEGYLVDGAGAALKQACATRAIPFEIVHTSGHASPGDLKRLANAIAPTRLIPIHTFFWEMFPKLFNNVNLIDDGQWIEV
jgi:ribonuclease J